MRAPRVLLTLACLATFPVRIPAQGLSAARAVTVAVRVDAAQAGPYELTPAAGVRAVSPRTGTAASGDLPLTFILAPSLVAGRQQIASLALAGGAVPVWCDVPERRGLRLAAPPRPLELAAGSRHDVTISVENLGNVVERAAVRVAAGSLAVRSVSDSVTVQAGGTVSIPLQVAVPAAVRAGTAEQVRVTLVTSSGTTASSTLRVTVAPPRRATLPLEIGVLAGPEGAAQTWISSDGWISDSVQLKLTLGDRRHGWPAVGAARAPGVSLSAPAWRFAAGELALPRPTDLVPWLSGTGGGAELGRMRGARVGGTWISDPRSGAAAGLLSASGQLQGVQLEGGVLSVQREDGRLLLPTVGLSWRGSGVGGLAAGALRTGVGWTPLGSARIQSTLAGLRLSGAAARVAVTGWQAPATLSSSVTARVDVPVGAASTLFISAAANRVDRDTASGTPAVTSGASLRAGLRLRTGAFALGQTVELRSADLAAAGAFEARTATTALAWGIGSGWTLRSDARWGQSMRRGHTSTSPRLGAALAWTGSPGFVTLSGAYGSPSTWTSGLRPATQAEIVAGLRTSSGSVDLSAAMMGQPDARLLLHGSVAASLRVAPATDALMAIRRLPGLTHASPWEVAVGLRSTIGIPIPQAMHRRIVFEDVNANGRRDAGERGVAGVPIAGEDWSGVSDAGGRFSPPSDAQVAPDLSQLGTGWRVGRADARQIALVRRGAIRATVFFLDLDPNALERVPRGSLVLVGAGGAPVPAELDSTGAARWTDLPAATYRVFHLPPGATLGSTAPESAVAVAVAPGAEVDARIPAGYAPRKVAARRLGESAPTALAPTAPGAATAPPRALALESPPPTAASPGCGASAGLPRVVRPGMTEAVVRCLLGPPARVSRRGAWSYWFYPRSPGGAGGVYDDIVFFRDVRLVTAILRESGRHYDGPPPHQQLVRELRGIGRRP